MRRALFVLALISVIAFSTVAMAEESTVSVPLTLTISSDFGFTLDKYSYAFGVGNLETTIGIYCRSNNGNVWYMALNADPFQSTTDTMPSDPGFKCAAWSNEDDEQALGSFGIYDDEGGQVVPSVQDDFYTSTLAEGSDNFVPLVLGLYVTIPEGQASGLYETDLVLTMHE